MRVPFQCRWRARSYPGRCLHSSTSSMSSWSRSFSCESPLCLVAGDKDIHTEAIQARVMVVTANQAISLLSGMGLWEPDHQTNEPTAERPAVMQLWEAGVYSMQKHSQVCPPTARRGDAGMAGYWHRPAGQYVAFGGPRPSIVGHQRDSVDAAPVGHHAHMLHSRLGTRRKSMFGSGRPSTRGHDDGLTEISASIGLLRSYPSARYPVGRASGKSAPKPAQPDVRFRREWRASPLFVSPSPSPCQDGHVQSETLHTRARAKRIMHPGRRKLHVQTRRFVAGTKCAR